jgi:hypothetical protein
VLRQLLNRDGMNKLSQLSVSVSFTLRGGMSGSVPIYVARGFHTFNQTYLSCSPVDIPR